MYVIHPACETSLYTIQEDCVSFDQLPCSTSAPSRGIRALHARYLARRHTEGPGVAAASKHCLCRQGACFGSAFSSASLPTRCPAVASYPHIDDNILSLELCDRTQVQFDIHENPVFADIAHDPCHSLQPPGRRAHVAPDRRRGHPVARHIYASESERERVACSLVAALLGVNTWTGVIPTSSSNPDCPRKWCYVYALVLACMHHSVSPLHFRSLSSNEASRR
ncbi:hypothetical protein V8E55_006943 [Tylopilus felleus]